MSDKALLEQAETYLSQTNQGPERSAEWKAHCTQLSIAASLLVIARNSLPVTVEHQEIEYNLRVEPS